MYAITGRSGAGKTTTLSLLGALDKPKQGKIFYNGKDLEEIGYSEYRRRYVGIVFQDYNLLPYFSVINNVIAAMEITGIEKKEQERAGRGVIERCRNRGNTFSKESYNIIGRRAAESCDCPSSRKNAELLLADEPTGNLDDETSEQIIALLKRLAHDEKKCVIIVTHSQNVVEQADKVLCLENGILI